MTVVAYAAVPVSALRAGDVIAYGGDQFTVAEVVPTAVLSGDVVVAFAADGKRVALIYSNADSSAELVSLRGAR